METEIELDEAIKELSEAILKEKNRQLGIVEPAEKVCLHKKNAEK